LFAEAVLLNINTMEGIATLKCSATSLKALKNIYSTNFNMLVVLVTLKVLAFATKKS
jgi:hypothetical protein